MFRLIIVGLSLLSVSIVSGGCKKKIKTEPKSVDKKIKDAEKDGCDASKEGLTSAIFLDPKKFADWMSTPTHMKAATDPKCKKLTEALGEVILQKLINDLDDSGCNVSKAGLTVKIAEDKDKMKAWQEKHTDLMTQSQCKTGFQKFLVEMAQYEQAFLGQVMKNTTKQVEAAGKSLGDAGKALDGGLTPPKTEIVA